MYKIKEDDMIVIELGYKNIVLPNKDAVTLLDILEKAEIYESKWVTADKRENGGPDYTHHIYENTQQFGLKMISNDLYRMAKLAGKPEEKK
jgi:predicted DNA-binding ArsR family transcriptional regulator